MSAQSDINKKVFVPRGETMLVAVEVRRRRRTAGRRILQLSTRGGEYATYLCLSVTNRTPPQLLITKVKQFAGSAPFVTRSQWGVDQLRQVNGIDPNKDCPDFDLVFDNTVDQWLCSSSAEKCIFILILYQAYKTYSGGPTGPPVCLRKSCVPARGTEFINCQPKLTGEACTMNLVIYRVKAFFTRLKKRVLAKRPAPRSKGHFSGGIMSNVVQRVTVSVGERGQRLTRAEDQTLELMHKAQQFADTAHKLLSSLSDIKFMTQP
uniref:Syntaxin binding protein 6 (amisyn), like n=1 Tax=Gadus morhua TaxID=8049 RepID=A0A8C5F3V7_GADMO